MTVSDSVKRLEQVYETIRRERMGDMPFVNPALGVRAIGFRAWREFEAGILLTPWCMNLILLPTAPDASPTMPGHEIEHRFPSGDYRFVAGEEPELGRYLSCSLFSPMFDFPDQATAVAVAEDILRHLFTAPQPAGISRRQLLRGHVRSPEAGPA